jgi:hypothetical protein
VNETAKGGVNPVLTRRAVHDDLTLAVGFSTSFRIIFTEFATAMVSVILNLAVY